MSDMSETLGEWNEFKKQEKRKRYDKNMIKVSDYDYT